MTPLQNRIREALQKQEDGMTVGQLTLAVRGSPEAIRKALSRMGDSYIDRWVKEGWNFSAVHCLVAVPEDCPRP